MRLFVLDLVGTYCGGVLVCLTLLLHLLWMWTQCFEEKGIYVVQFFCGVSLQLMNQHVCLATRCCQCKWQLSERLFAALQKGPEASVQQSTKIVHIKNSVRSANLSLRSLFLLTILNIPFVLILVLHIDLRHITPQLVLPLHTRQHPAASALLHFLSCFLNW